MVDDHEAARAGLESILGRRGDMRVVGSFRSGEEAVKAVRGLDPDVAVVDYRLAGKDGAWTCAELRRLNQRTAVVVLTAFLEESAFLDCLRAGAAGFVLKSGDISSIVDAVGRVGLGEHVIASEAMPMMLEFARNTRRRHLASGELGSQDVEIVRLVALGRKNREIAAALHVTDDAIKTAIRAIKSRLGASHRAQIVTLATQKGLL